MSEADRHVERVRRRLLAQSFPRLQMLLLLSFSGLGAFFFSVALFRAGVAHMAARYFLATAAGYAFFLLSIRVWLERQLGRWREAGSPGQAVTERPHGSDPDLGPLDLLDGIDSPGCLAAVALLFGVVLLAAFLYTSPLLLAEVLVDAAVVGAIYPAVRDRPRAHWLRGVLRRTWLQALVLCLLLGALGFGLQQLAPGAHTFGAAIRELRAP